MRWVTVPDAAVVLFATYGAKRRAALGRLLLFFLRKLTSLKLHKAGSSTVPVAVRPPKTAQGLKTVRGLLRSFTALASPCALRLLVVQN